MTPHLPSRLLNRFLFQPPEPRRTTPRMVGLDYKRLDIETADGELLRGWWVEARARRRGHMLFFHGNAEDISDCISDAELLTGIGFDVLLVDYRGYGHSSGRPSEDGTYLDAEAALDCLLSRPRVNPRRLFYFGRSLGGAVALKLACDRPPSGLILMSTFASVAEIGSDVLGLPGARTLSRAVANVYPSYGRIGELRAPLLVLHGDADDLIPLEHAERLYKAARRPKRFHVFAASDHNDPGDPDELAAVLVEWQEGLSR